LVKKGNKFTIINQQKEIKLHRILGFDKEIFTKTDNNITKVPFYLFYFTFLVGGNPAPRLVWLLGERRLEGKLEQEQEGRTLSRLLLPVSREDDGRILKCEARHEALTESLRAEAPLTIQCEKLKKTFIVC
jgi:hypothetical protein